MSKMRMVNTDFWSDPWVVDNLNPLDAHLFMYLFTNQHTNVAGVYEISLRTMSSEVGIEKEELGRMLKRLEPKVHYIQNWVILSNGIKNQNYHSPNVQIGIKLALEKCPAGLLQYVNWPNDFEMKKPEGNQQTKLPVEDEIGKLDDSAMRKPRGKAKKKEMHDGPVATNDSKTVVIDDNTPLSNLTTSNRGNGPSTDRRRYLDLDLDLNKQQSNSKDIEQKNNPLHLKKQVQQVYDHFVTCFKKDSARYKLTPKRKQAIERRLATDDAGLDMLLDAITKASEDKFYSGDNDRNWVANLEYITRSYENVENLSNLNPSRKRKFA